MDHEVMVLPNGLRLVHAPMPEMGSVSIAIFVGFGSRYESAFDAGAAHLIEHMLFKGTARRPSAAAISETLESVGGILNASTDKEVTVYWAKVARDHLPLAVDLLADMLRRSRFTPTDLIREKSVIVEELGMLLDDPQDWVHTLAEEILWPEQPMGREIAGTRESVCALKRRDILRHFKRYYGANNVVISIAGGVSEGEARELVVKHFGEWETVPAGTASPAHVPDGAVRSRVEYKPTEQVNMCLSFEGVPRNHPDRWALDVVSTILGGSTSSRLFVQLRERLALAYDIHSYTTHAVDTGSFVIYGATDAAKSNRMMEGIFRELDRLQRRRVTDRELWNAKHYFRGRLWLGLEDTHAVASWFGAQEILNRAIITPEEAAAAVDEVTADDLLRVARTHLPPARANLAAVGPVTNLGLETRRAGA